MATSWIMGTIHNAIAPTISGAIQSAGSVAGDAVGAVGGGINGVGESINGSIRRYGDGTKDYGNAIKDYTKAPGVRVSTAGNPLGLSSNAEGGKNAFSTPMYRAPPPSNSKALPASTAKKPAAGTAAKSAAINTRKPASGNINKLPQNTGSASKPPAYTQRPPTGPATRAGSGVPMGGNKATGSKPGGSGVPMGGNKSASSGVPMGGKKGPSSGTPMGAHKGVNRGSTVTKGRN